MDGFATVQDAGRPGHRADGVPLSGAMDGPALGYANFLVGNDAGVAGIEWALAGGNVRSRGSVVVAITGATAELSRNGKPIRPDTAIDLKAGDELAVGRFVRGAFIYLAVRGGIDVPVVLGSRSTYIPAAFGGLVGRRIRGGDVLPLGRSRLQPRPAALPRLTARRDATDAIRVVERAASAALPGDFRDAFWASEFTVSRSSDRMGFRLERAPHPGPELGVTPSEPVCVGAIQVPAGDSAIVLMPDGPTVGGYPTIGVVSSVDLPILAQKTPGDSVRFARIGIEDAQRQLRAALVAGGNRT
jgi:antagonist of KipI